MIILTEEDSIKTVTQMGVVYLFTGPRNDADSAECSSIVAESKQTETLTVLTDKRVQVSGSFSFLPLKGKLRVSLNFRSFITKRRLSIQVEISTKES